MRVKVSGFVRYDRVSMIVLWGNPTAAPHPRSLGQRSSVEQCGATSSSSRSPALPDTNRLPRNTDSNWCGVRAVGTALRPQFLHGLQDGSNSLAMLCLPPLVSLWF